MDDLRNKFIGGLMGLMLGDALGAPHEFRNSSDVYTGKLEYRPRIPSRYQGVRYGVIGQVTDDSEKCLALIYSMIPTAQEKVSYDEDRAAIEYMAWANNKPMGMGFNTRKLFYGVKTVNGFRKRQEKTFTDVSQSNGSLMHCYPLALIDDETVWQQDVNLTNPDKINREASNVFLSLVRAMWSGTSKKEAINKQLNRSLSLVVKTAIKHAISPTGVNKKLIVDDWKYQPYQMTGKCKGWVVCSLYAAIWGWYHHDTLKDCLNAIISRGGDTDTNAAIGGALMGATLGRERILQERRSRRNWRKIVTAVPRQGDFPRPNKYMWMDMDEIADALHVTAPLMKKRKKTRSV